MFQGDSISLSRRRDAHWISLALHNAAVDDAWDAVSCSAISRDIMY